MVDEESGRAVWRPHVTVRLAALARSSAGDDTHRRECASRSSVVQLPVIAKGVPGWCSLAPFHLTWLLFSPCTDDTSQLRNNRRTAVHVRSLDTAAHHITAARDKVEPCAMQVPRWCDGRRQPSILSAGERRRALDVDRNSVAKFLVFLQAAVLLRGLRAGLEAALEQLVGGSGSETDAASGSSGGGGSKGLIDTAARLLQAEEAALLRDRV